MPHRIEDIEKLINERTLGKPYVFVIMSFGNVYGIFERIQKVVQDSVGFDCFRADDFQAAGYNLLSRMHLLIERADLIIAEITQHSPNVFYEIGY